MNPNYKLINLSHSLLSTTKKCVQPTNKFVKRAPMFLIDYSTYSKNIKKQIQKTNIDVKIKNFDECKIEEIMSRTTKHEMKVHVKIK